MGAKNWFKRRRHETGNTTKHTSDKARVDDSPSSTPGTSRASSSESESHKNQGKMRRSAMMNLGNVKGHQTIVGTCDIRNDKQATAELIDLLNETAERMANDLDSYHSYDDGKEEKKHDGDENNHSNDKETISGPETASPSKAVQTEVSGIIKTSPKGQKRRLFFLAKVCLPHSTLDESIKPQSRSSSDNTSGAADGNSDGSNKDRISLEESLRRELEATRAGTTREANRFVAVNTSVKGVVMVCVKDAKIDVVRLVDAVFDDIRVTKKRRSRFLERVTPMKVTTFADFNSLKEAAKAMVEDALPPVADGVPPIDLPERTKPTVPTAADTTAENTVAPTIVATERTSSPGFTDNGVTPKQATEVKQTTPASVASEVAVDTAVTRGGNGCSAATSPAPADKSGNNAAVLATENNIVAKTADKRWTFRVDPRRRHSSVKRLDLINAVAGSAGEGHTVTMTNPEVCTCGWVLGHA